MRRLLSLLCLVVLLIPVPARAQSNDFAAGQLVVVSAASETLRAAPGDTAAAVATVSAGEELQVLADDPAELDGGFWWNVRSIERAVSGWLPDGALGPKYLAPTPDPGQRGAGPCEGLQEYQGYYEISFSSTTLMHLAAIGILTEAGESPMGAQAFIESLTTRELTLLGAFYLDLAAMMDELSPPDFALEWHQLQRDAFQMTGEIYTEAATMGLAAAGEAHSATAIALVAATIDYFSQPSTCPSFLTWAREQSVYSTIL